MNDAPYFLHSFRLLSFFLSSSLSLYLDIRCIIFTKTFFRQCLQAMHGPPRCTAGRQALNLLSPVHPVAPRKESRGHRPARLSSSPLSQQATSLATGHTASPPLHSRPHSAPRASRLARTSHRPRPLADNSRQRRRGAARRRRVLSPRLKFPLTLGWGRGRGASPCLYPFAWTLVKDVSECSSRVSQL